MGKWEAGLIHKDAAYRNQNATKAHGVFSLENQMRHAANNNWPKVSYTYPDDDGQRIPATIIGTSITGDSDEAYQVHHEDFDAAAAVATTGRLYLAVKVTASTAYYNDFCLGAIQLVSDDYSTLDKGWSFSLQTDYQAWEAPSVHNIGVAGTTGFENLDDILTAPSQSWSALLINTANFRWSWNASTGSTFTGCNNGVGNSFSSSDTGTIIGSGTSTQSQSSVSKYAFTESSGANVNNKYFWMRSPSITLNGEGDKNLVVVYNAVTRNTAAGMTDSAEEPLVRWWWVG